MVILDKLFFLVGILFVSIMVTTIIVVALNICTENYTKESIVLISDNLESLKEKKILPNLTIIRVGSKEEDLSYERGAKKKMESLGIDVHILELPETITQEEFVRAFQKVNDDENVHGILVFLPLPRHLDENKLYIKETYINEGTTLKRSKIASRGSVDRRDKRTSHIVITVATK